MDELVNQQQQKKENPLFVQRHVKQEYLEHMQTEAFQFKDASHEELQEKTRERIQRLHLEHMPENLSDKEMRELLKYTTAPTMKPAPLNQSYHERKKYDSAKKAQEKLEKQAQDNGAVLQSMYHLRRAEAERWPDDIPATAQAMDQALVQGNLDYNDIFKTFGKNQVNTWTSYMKMRNKKNATVAKAVKHYTGSAYGAMNGYLRGKDKVSSKIKSETDLMRNAMKKQYLRHTMVTRRSAGANCLPFMLGCSNLRQAIDKLKAYKPGESEPIFMEEKGFCSTAVGTRDQSSPAFYNHVEFIIRLPKGTEALPISETKLESYKGEREILLNAGTRFRLLEYQTLNADQQQQQYPSEYAHTRPIIKIYMEAIPQHDAGVPA